MDTYSLWYLMASYDFISPYTMIQRSKSPIDKLEKLYENKKSMFAFRPKKSIWKKAFDELRELFGMTRKRTLWKKVRNLFKK